MYVPTLQDIVLSSKISIKSNASKVQGKESVWTFRDYLSYFELKELRTRVVGNSFFGCAETRVSLTKEYSVEVQRGTHEHGAQQPLHNSPLQLC